MGVCFWSWWYTVTWQLGYSSIQTPPFRCLWSGRRQKQKHVSQPPPKKSSDVTDIADASLSPLSVSTLTSTNMARLCSASSTVLGNMCVRCALVIVTSASPLVSYNDIKCTIKSVRGRSRKSLFTWQTFFLWEYGEFAHRHFLEGTWKACFLIVCAVCFLINLWHNPKYHIGHPSHRLPKQVPMKRYQFHNAQNKFKSK